MTTTTTSRPTAYAVFYCGAPYGDDETGELVSRHRTLSAARLAHTKLQDSLKYHGTDSRVMLKINGEWQRDGR